MISRSGLANRNKSASWGLGISLTQGKTFRELLRARPVRVQHRLILRLSSRRGRHMVQAEIAALEARMRLGEGGGLMSD
jgi:hypothetical protein